MKRAWLITAFDSFAKRPENNSQNVLNEIKKLAALNKSDPSWNFEFHFKILPTAYDHCAEVLLNEVESLKQQGVKLEGVLSLGEGAEDFKIEIQASNMDDVPGFPDNHGIIRTEEKIFKDLDLHATIPLRFPFEGFTRIRSSQSAGNFVCNHLCAKIARAFSDEKFPYFGFIHVPRTGMGGVFTADVCAAMIVNGFKKI